MTQRRIPLVRAALAVNASLTALCGLVLLVAGGALAAPLGLADPLPLRAAGAVFLAFGAALARTAARDRTPPRAAAVLTLMDVGYVLASALLLVAWPQLLSPRGRLVVAAAATTVALLVTAQLVGLRRLSADPGRG